MADKIKKLHDKALTFLLSWRKKNPDFTFALRKSDLSKKLSEGYWFYGNKERILLSFWTGMDWVSKVPNISFCYDLKLDEYTIKFSINDSAEKQYAILELNTPDSHANSFQDTHFQEHSSLLRGKGLIKNLEFFLKTDKIKIDEFIKNNRPLFENKLNPRNSIGFISEEEFKKNLKRTLKYRQKQGTDILSISLVNIQIKNFGPITNLDISDIPVNTQWIFLTGENGTGKTSILRAMATAFTNGTLSLGPHTTVSNRYNIGLSLNKYGRTPRHRIIKKESSLSPKKEFNILTEGFVAFGPIRLNISDDRYINPQTPRKGYLKIFDRPYEHLFRTTGFLLDIGSIYNTTNKIHELIRGNEDKIGYIIEVITRICDSITEIHFGRSMRYFEVDKNNQLLNDKGTVFRNLASGYKSIIAMVSHMMLHLFYQQPHINDPSELVGIVIIDEIDLHFHPKMQRDLVIRLTEIFPRIQFIVSTHSPIPLLGAPINSIILTVKRSAEKGVYIERTDDDTEFQNLLPNSILTSPIFNLQEIIPESHKEDMKLETEDNYNDVVFYRILDEKLKNIRNKYKTDD
jgi:AAA domain, putative AbiEii toxin, Type IV TA system/AAA domain